MQRKDFIGDGIVVLLAVGLSDELLLQLVDPCLDIVRAHRVGGYYSFCDVLLHLTEEAVLVVEYLVERLGCDCGKAICPIAFCRLGLSGRLFCFSRIPNMIY